MNNVRTTVLLAGLTGLLLAIGSLCGGSEGMTVMFVISMVINFVTYWFSDRIVLGMYGAQEVTAKESPDLIRMVAALAQKAKLPMPKVYIIQTDAPNAFATGRNPHQAAVAVTTGMLKVVDQVELEGVIAHELAHIRNRDTLVSSIVASLAGMITAIAHIAQWAVFWGAGRNGEEGSLLGRAMEGLILIILTPLAATLLQLGVSRSREYLADESGATIAGNPLALARALEKLEYHAASKLMPEATPSTSHMFIVNPFSSGSRGLLSNLFSTHPSTKDRIARLQELAKRI